MVQVNSILCIVYVQIFSCSNYSVGISFCFGFRNILCFPIKDETNKVIGVAQLCNKLGAEGFSNFDVDIAQAFSVYCCISIQHVST